jgi:hypothetical protein
MIRTFNVVISKIGDKYVVSCDGNLLNKGRGEESLNDLFEILRNTRGFYEREAQEYAMIRVFMKNETNPVRVF